MIDFLFKSRFALLIAFAFAVMGDPVSSVAYAIEAALRALHGDLGLLVVTMAIVLGVICLVSLNYHQLYTRFPEGATRPLPAKRSVRDGHSCPWAR